MKAMEILDPRATFVDVGSERMHVSIGGGTPVVFGTVTSQLHALRDWLLSHQVRAVAMEATGVYWMPLYSILEEAGLEVSMVNGKQIKNLPGRKSDMSDCQWGSTLLGYGLLRAGFVPPAEIRRLQDYMRLRGDPAALPRISPPLLSKIRPPDVDQVVGFLASAFGMSKSFAGTL